MILDWLKAIERSQALPLGELELNPKDVHVWQVSPDQPVSLVEELMQTLSPDERTRAEGFRFEQDRRWFILRRGLLRAILGCYLDINPGQLQFCYGDHGKPSVVEPFYGTGLSFSVSHSHGLALYAVGSGREMGIDIERVHPLPEAERLADQFFSVWENTVFGELPLDKRLQAFFSCWTRKEAFLKATGYGLAWPLKSFSVSLSPEEPARLISVSWDPAELSRWSFVELAPIPGYAGALCVEGHDWHITYWR